VKQGVDVTAHAKRRGGEFFAQYAALFTSTQEALETIVKKDAALRAEFSAKKVATADFTKKLLGQIVFLYFIQKKGWLGVPKGDKWGDGPRNFMRRIVNSALWKRRASSTISSNPFFMTRSLPTADQLLGASGFSAGFPS
jgi:hypothetical protein